MLVNTFEIQMMGHTHRKKTKVLVLVAISLIGMAACMAISGVYHRWYDEMHRYNHNVVKSHLEQTTDANGSNKGVDLLLCTKRRGYNDHLNSVLNINIRIGRIIQHDHDTPAEGHDNPAKPHDRAIGPYASDNHSRK
jgi:hypothetical protein